MKLKEGFVTQQMGDEQIMVATGAANFSGLVRSNATAAFIVDCLSEDVTAEQVVAKMLERYDVSQELAAADVQKILTKLRSIGALDE